MEVCTLINLVAMASQESNHNIDEEDAKLTEEGFNNIVKTIYRKTDLLKKWTQTDSEDSGEEDDTDDEDQDEDEDSEDTDEMMEDKEPEQEDLEVSASGEDEMRDKLFRARRNIREC